MRTVFWYFPAMLCPAQGISDRTLLILLKSKIYSVSFFASTTRLYIILVFDFKRIRVYPASEFLQAYSYLRTVDWIFVNISLPEVIV